MLEVQDLVRRYDGRLALDGVSLAVAAGEIVGLLGPNGAGKSTLLRTIAGLQPPDSGAVRIEGVDVWREPVAARRAVGFAPEEPAFYEELSAEEYLGFLAAVRGLEPSAAQARASEMFTRLGLADRTARTRHDPHFVGPGAKPEEPARALLQDGDHHFRARPTECCQTLLDGVVQRATFECGLIVPHGEPLMPRRAQRPRECHAPRIV